jgi:hypothetical protein
MAPVDKLLAPILQLHERIRDQVVSRCEHSSLEELASVSQDSHGDTIFAVDRVSEELLVEFFEREMAPFGPLVLIAEGLPEGQLVLPRGCAERKALWRILVDPIDGTRGLMYQKRSAWVLTGVAPNRGSSTTLQDIELAVQTEIPLTKQHLCDTLWTMRGEKTVVQRTNRLTNARWPLDLRPSRAETVRQGFATIARFFAGTARDELAAIDEEVMHRVLGAPPEGKALCFEDQYISTGGQLYELLAGHDRFTADIRPLMKPVLARRGLALGLCCHPYDLCTELVARNAGVIITDATGGPLRATMSLTPDVSWVGYANEPIRRQMEPALQAVLRDRGLGQPSSQALT